ncbi:MAG: hypothetical protein QG564_1841 [Campylobacterota bacterium]|nr:hypothetical protein [Campylobacterota bacterium]
MSDSITNLDLISSSQQQKEITFNAAADAMSAQMVLGRREKTSVNRTFGYYGGVLNGDSVLTIANGTVELVASTTNYIECNPTTGVVSINQIGFTNGYISMYEVVTSNSTWTSYTDRRPNPIYSKTVIIKDEVLLLTKSPLSINFTGNGVAATNTGDDVEVVINQTTTDNLSELIDINITAPANNDMLFYDTATSKWINLPPSGGSADPWTYIKLSADAVNSTTTLANITDFSFAVGSGKTYEIEVKMNLANAAADGHTLAIADFSTFATGFTKFFVGVNATTSQQTITNATTPTHTTTTSQATVFGMIKCILTTTASGTINIQSAAEIAASTSTVAAGSILRYREI